MGSVGRLPLESGGVLLFEAGESLEDPGAGPVKAGRVTDAVSGTLQKVLEPVQEMASAVVSQLRALEPSEIEVEFGVDLSAEFGVIVSKGEAAANLRVRVQWTRVDDTAETR